MSDIHAIIFDIDGTLLDTREFILKATEHTLHAHGFAVPSRAEISKHVGIHFDQFYTNLTGLKEIAHLKEFHGKFQMENIHLSELYPGTKHTLETLKKTGLKLGAVTSRGKASVLQTLEAAGILDYFDALITTSEVENLKPHPEPILKALDLMQADPSETLVVGDSYVDVAAGKSAGTKTVRALYGFHHENLENPKPDYTIEKIEELLKILNLATSIKPA